MIVMKCSKFSKLGFNSTWIMNFQIFKLELEKADEAEIKLPTSTGSQEKQENFRKTSTSASLTKLKPLTVWITTNWGKFLQRWEYQTNLSATWETCMQVKNQQNRTWDNKLVLNWKKKYIKAVYCHPACLTYMQSKSCEMLGWMYHKLESRLLREIATISDVQIVPL